MKMHPIAGDPQPGPDKCQACLHSWHAIAGRLRKPDGLDSPKLDSPEA
jgi:hypothetical protein